MKLENAIKLLDTPSEGFGKIIIKSNILRKWLIKSYRGDIHLCTQDRPVLYSPQREDYEICDWYVDAPEIKRKCSICGCELQKALDGDLVCQYHG